MKSKRIVALALAVLMVAAFAATASAASFHTDTGYNDVSSYHASPLYIVNDKNELWKFSFPNELGSAASGTKIADGVKQVVADITEATVLKTNGEVWTYSVMSEALTATELKNVASFAGDDGAYITNNGDLMDENNVLIDTDVKIATYYSYLHYVKNDGRLYAYKDSTISGVLLENVEKIYEDQDTCFAITADKELYAWGGSEYGQTGVPTSSPNFVVSYLRFGGANVPMHYVSAPTLVMGGVDRVIADTFITRVVTTDGKVITWGDASDVVEEPDAVKPKTVTADQWMAEASAVFFHEYHMAYYTTRQVVQHPNGTLELRQARQVTSGMTDAEVVFPEYTFTVDMTLLSLSGSTPAAPTADAPSSWATASVNAAIAAGIVPAALQSKYTTATTRAEFCALAVALYEKQCGTITARAKFDDTTDVNVEKMAALGVVNGTGEGKFSPNSQLTREQAATMLARLAAAMGKPQVEIEASFADNAEIASWARTAVGQVQAAGIMGGTGDNKFSPKGSYTREQSILTIMRLYDMFA